MSSPTQGFATAVELRLAWRSSAIVVLALWALFAHPWLLGQVTIPYDAKALFQAQLQFLATALHSGQSPAWNPHTFVGVPQIADPQSFIFSPGMLLAALSAKPSFWLLDAYVFALLGAGAGAILMLFRDRGWHPGGAAVAAICFAFGGSASWRMQHIGQVQSYAFFALTLWLIVRARDRRSPKWAAGAGLAAGLMLAEPDQVAMLACYLLAIVIAADWLMSPSPAAALRRDLGPVSIAAAVALLIAALPLALTYFFLSGSNRPRIEFAEAARGSLEPASLLTLLISDLYGVRDTVRGYWGPYSEPWNPRELTLSPNMSQLYMGALPCLVIIRAAITRGMLWRREIVGYSAAAAVALVYALGSSTPLFRLAYEAVPGVALFRRPADATFLIAGFLAIVAGYLVHVELTSPTLRNHRTSRLSGMAISALMLIAAGIAARHNRLETAGLAILSSGAMLLAAALSLKLAQSRKPWGRLAAFLPALLLGADLAVNNGPSESTGKPVDRSTEALRTETRNETIAFLTRHVRRVPGTPWRDRIELAGIGFDWQNAAEAHGLDQTLGYNPLRTALVTRAIGAGDYIAGPEQRHFSPLFPSYRCRLADLLGLRFIASPVPIGRLDRRIGSEDLNLLARTADAYLYENPRALPRVLFAEQAKLADFDRILADGRWPEFDPQRTVLLDAKSSPELAVRLPPRTAAGMLDGYSWTDTMASGPASPVQSSAEAEAIILRYENTRVDVSVNAPRPGYLVLSDVWHPWWSARVDGRPSAIRRANVMFRAVDVPAGRHLVRFEFQPMAGIMADLGRKLLPRPR